MSWRLRKSNVALRIAQFAPHTEVPVAGLTPEAREAHRARRSAEQRKVEPALSLQLDEEDEGFDEPEFYSEYGDWKNDYADAIGISRTREL